jgi:hypothetical protein
MPDEEARDLGGPPPNLMIDTRIQQFLMDDPGDSVLQTATGKGIPASTVWDFLMICLAQVSARFAYTQRSSWRGKAPTKSGASYHRAPGEIYCLALLFDRR